MGICIWYLVCHADSLPCQTSFDFEYIEPYSVGYRLLADPPHDDGMKAVNAESGSKDESGECRKPEERYTYVIMNAAEPAHHGSSLQRSSSLPITSTSEYSQQPTSQRMPDFEGLPSSFSSDHSAGSLSKRKLPPTPIQCPVRPLPPHPSPFKQSPSRRIQRRMTLPKDCTEKEDDDEPTHIAWADFMKGLDAVQPTPTTPPSPISPIQKPIPKPRPRRRSLQRNHSADDVVGIEQSLSRGINRG